MFATLEILNSIKNKPGTVIIKHANPCGVSENKNALYSFKNAYASDPVSAFGGVIACNFKISKKIALEITKNFSEVILAKGFEKDAFLHYLDLGPQFLSLKSYVKKVRGKGQKHPQNKGS